MSEEQNNRSEEEEVPEGMVRKKRRVRKKRKQKRSVSEGKQDAGKLFSKAKDLLIGMEENDDDYGPVDVAEQVRRLKNKKTEDDRPLDDVWGTKKRSSAWLWIVLVGLIGSVIAIMVGVTLWVTDEPAPQVNAEDLVTTVGNVEEGNLSEGLLGWFNEDSVGALDEVKEIIKTFNNAESVETVSGSVRPSPYRDFHPVEPGKWGSPLLTNPTSKFRWTSKVVVSPESAEDGELGYLQVNGTRENGDAFEVYFVHRDDQILLDWDASLGWSEVPFPEFIEKEPRKGTLLRCRMTKEHVFDQSFGKIAYSGYLLSGDLSDQFCLAYVPLNTERGKKMDRDLRKMLNFGSGVTDKPPYEDHKVTLRVRHGDDLGNDGIFEILEFVHEGWVTP